MIGEEAILQMHFIKMLEQEFPECFVICVMAESTKGVVTKLMSAMGYKSGIPDVIITLPNKCIYVELKAPNKGKLKHLRSMQEIRRYELIRKGFDYKLADSSNDFYDIMEQLYKLTNKQPSIMNLNGKEATFWACMDNMITLSLRHRKKIKTLHGCSLLELTTGEKWEMRQLF